MSDKEGAGLLAVRAEAAGQMTVYLPILIESGFLKKLKELKGLVGSDGSCGRKVRSDGVMVGGMFWARQLL